MACQTTIPLWRPCIKTWETMYVLHTIYVQTLTSYCLCVTTGAIFEQSQGWQLNKHQRQQIRINADKFKIEQFRMRQSYLEVLKQIWECLKGLP